MIIFLSYAKEDSERVGLIYKELKEAGYQPWMDNHDISPGQNWQFEIKNAISICNAAIIVLSSKSVSKTGYVQVELKEFLEQRKRRPERSIYLIPVRLEPCAIPHELSDLHYADLFDSSGWDRVITSLEKAKSEQSLIQEQGEKRGTFTVFTRVIEEQWDGSPGYLARLSYPELRGGATAEACEEINQVFKARCLSTLHGLRANCMNQDPSVWERRKEFGTATYKTIKDYRITFLSNTALSIVDSYLVYTCGAHENFYFTTDNFVLQPTVSELSLGTFFQRHQDYRKVLGLQAREALKRQAWERSLSSETSSEFYANMFVGEGFSKDWLMQGTEFKDNTDVRFTFSQTGVTLYFRPYEVACFAAGNWEVTLPYYDLREILPASGIHELFIPSSQRY
jgi:hypothetical protein